MDAARFCAVPSPSSGEGFLLCPVSIPSCHGASPRIPRLRNSCAPRRWRARSPLQGSTSGGSVGRWVGGSVGRCTQMMERVETRRLNSCGCTATNAGHRASAEKGNPERPGTALRRRPLVPYRVTRRTRSRHAHTHLIINCTGPNARRPARCVACCACRSGFYPTGAPNETESAPFTPSGMLLKVRDPRNIVPVSRTRHYVRRPRNTVRDCLVWRGAACRTLICLGCGSSAERCASSRPLPLHCGVCLRQLPLGGSEGGWVERVELGFQRCEWNA
jgi:hypothetical protein